MRKGWLHTILLRAECVRSDTVAPFIQTRRSPLHTPALSAAPPRTRLTEKRPFSPREHKKEEQLNNTRPSVIYLIPNLGLVVLPSTGVKLMPRPETGSLVMWQSLGGLQLSHLWALPRLRRSWPRDTACSYCSPPNTNKHNCCPLSFIFLATWFIQKKKQLQLKAIQSCHLDNKGSSSYLRVRDIINMVVVDFQKPVSILKAAAPRHPSWHNISDYVALASLLHPQMEAIGLRLLLFKNAQTRAECPHRVWAEKRKRSVVRAELPHGLVHRRYSEMCLPVSSVVTITGLSIPSFGLNVNLLQNEKLKKFDFEFVVN